jgi:RES domain
VRSRKTLPPTTLISRDDTHRLIPSRFCEEGESVLSRLGLPPAQMDHLFQLDDATNARLEGEANLLTGITVHELVFGVPHYHIINASFTHARPEGSRFCGADRGAWYAGFSLKTAQTEVAFHYAEGLREVNWQEEETVVYREYLADFRAEFHDLRTNDLRGNDLRSKDPGKDTSYKKYLDPGSYRASQQLGRRLLDQGSAGVVFPSVRHAGGTCIACFRPALVGNVREGARVIFTFPDAFHAPEVSVSR